MPAFDRLRLPGKLLVWIAGEDYSLLTQRFERRSDVIVKEHDWQMDRLMSASDLAITKATLNTARELAVLGIPSISISHGQNPIDDVLIERIPTNIALDVRTVSAKALAKTIIETLKDSPGETTETPLYNNGGATRAAEALLAMIDRLALRELPT